jgi:chromosome segregation ATPase
MIEYYKEFLSLIGMVIAFFGGQRMKTLNEKSASIDNLKKYQEMYDTFATQYQKQYKSLEDKVNELEKDTANLNLRNAIIFEEAKSWKTKFEELQKLYDKLKKEFETYKLKHK